MGGGKEPAPRALVDTPLNPQLAMIASWGHHYPARETVLSLLNPNLAPLLCTHTFKSRQQLHCSLCTDTSSGLLVPEPSVILPADNYDGGGALRARRDLPGHGVCRARARHGRLLLVSL